MAVSTDDLIRQGNRRTEENIRLLESQGENAEKLGKANFELSLNEAAAKAFTKSGEVLKNV